jgi:ADP-ribose pyrophosphatase
MTTSPANSTTTASTGQHLVETCISTEPIFDGWVLKVRVDTVRLPNGQTGRREVATHPGGVVAMPILPDGRLVLVSQYRYALGQTLLEFPAGKLDTINGQKEDPLLAIKRELQEETGYQADQWTALGSIHTAPGFTNERLYLFKAEGLTAVEKLVQPDEFVETVLMTPQDLLAKIKTGEVTDAKTLCLMAHALMAGMS